MKNAINSIVLASLLSSCAIAPQGTEPTLIRKGLPMDLISITQPIDRINVKQTNDGLIIGSKL